MDTCISGGPETTSFWTLSRGLRWEIFKKKSHLNGIFYWLTDCLPDLHNSTMVKATGLIFHCYTSLQPERYLLPHCYTCNAFFMDLPVPSFATYSSSLTMKSIDFVVDTWWLPFTMEIVRNFHSGYFDCRSSFHLFKHWLICTAL